MMMDEESPAIPQHDVKGELWKSSRQRRHVSSQGSRYIVQENADTTGSEFQLEELPNDYFYTQASPEEDEQDSRETIYPQKPAEHPLLWHLPTASFLLTRLIESSQIKTILQYIYPPSFHPRSVYSWSYPHSFQLPERCYHTSLEQSQVRPEVLGQDSYSLNTTHPHASAELYDTHDFRKNADAFVCRAGQQWSFLIVQCTDSRYWTPNDTSWRRTYIRNVSPYLLRVAAWPTVLIKHVHHSNTRLSTVVNVAYGVLCLVLSRIILFFLLCLPSNIETTARDGHRYDPFPYQFRQVPKIAKNYRENPGLASKGPSVGATGKRYVYPRYLCFLNRIHGTTNSRMKTSDWVGEYGREPSYIYVSYIGSQFERPCRDGYRQKREHGLNCCPCAHCLRSIHDTEALHKIARYATKLARASAYWTDQCCLSDESEEVLDDIHGISDIVRQSRQVVIIVGRSGYDVLDDSSSSPSLSTDSLLREWGTRMWVFQEVLLGPAREDVLVYTRGRLDEVLSLSKMELAVRIWADAVVVRDLIESFDSGLALSQLELIVMGLTCLKDRLGGHTSFHDGDLVYALMGLVRHRPERDSTDTGFQALARLSFTMSSEKLLERIFCLHPVEEAEAESVNYDYLERGMEPLRREDERRKKEDERRHYWANLRDHWGANLWDIEPTCQVTGIADGDTVMIDGARAAPVHWDSFQRVSYHAHSSWLRVLMCTLVRGSPFIIVGGGCLRAFVTGSFAARVAGILLLTFGLVLLSCSPALILYLYSPRKSDIKARLFGFEGYLPLREIESHLFGYSTHQLKWSLHGSPLSRYRPSSTYDKDYEGLDPFPAGEHDITPLDGRTLTLVDTGTMTVTVFKAQRPPVAAVVCGHEGGMHRVLMCSYDWTMNALFRETVLRMDFPIVDKMDTVGKLRVGLRRRKTPD